MELNSIPPMHHEEATVSMKVILLIFAVLLVLVLGWLVWDQNRRVDETSANTVKPTAVGLKDTFIENKAALDSSQKLIIASFKFTK